jgi:hypothetical protein
MMFHLLWAVEGLLFTLQNWMDNSGPNEISEFFFVMIRCAQGSPEEEKKKEVGECLMKRNSGRHRVFVNLERPSTIVATQARIGMRSRGAIEHNRFRAFWGEARMSGTTLGARP